MGKAYFLLSNQFDARQSDNLLRCNVRSWKVDGIEQIDYNVYDVEVDQSQYYTINTYERTNDNFGSLAGVQPWNIWNPFVDCMKMTFDTLTNYGQCTGTDSGNSYGGWETSISVDKVEVVDGGGVTQYGAFGVDFDETKDLEIIIRISSTQYFKINWYSQNQNSLYVLITEDNTGITQIDNLSNLGWLDLSVTPISDDQLGNVQKYLGTAIPIPQLEEDDRGYDVCCPCSLVLADTIDVDDYKNDFFGAHHFKQSGESITWKLLKNGIEVSYAGIATVNDFGQLETFTFNWQSVLNIHGEDIYSVTKTVSIGALSLYTQTYNQVKLKTFTWDLANGTTRVDSYFDNELTSLGYSFKDTGFKHSSRVRGSFSNEQLELVSENNYNSEFKSINNFKRIESTYDLEISGIRDCIWMDFPEFYLLASNLKVTDYNKKAYSYRYKSLPVTLDSFEESTYTGSTRQAVHKIKFKDNQLNKISKYG